ncbi:MAG: ParB/RepB/Spo0J family partition protein [Clostridia bacterium]|nr:ParB/RepB/Spo0J family partition protein [Clostridia bacterium]
MKKQTGLGRGLEDLFAENSIDITVEEGQVTFVGISEVEPNKSQPRKFFDKEKIAELSTSIAEHGLLQPIIVRKVGERYQIISGERRWRASRMAGLTEIPVIVKDIDDKTALEIGLIENLQREDLNAVEEAKGYRTLIDEYGLTQEEIAKRVGKSRPVVANALRILALPQDVLDLVLAGKLTSGHARALLPLMETYSPEKLLQLAKDIIDKDLTVRQIENLSKEKKDKTEKQPKVRKNEIYYAEIEENISKQWGRKAKITPTGKKGGTITLEYYNDDDFNALLEALNIN